MLVLGSLLALISGMLNACAAWLEKREGMRKGKGAQGRPAACCAGQTTPLAAGDGARRPGMGGRSGIARPRTCAGGSDGAQRGARASRSRRRPLAGGALQPPGGCRCSVLARPAGLAPELSPCRPARRPGPASPRLPRGCRLARLGCGSRAAPGRALRLQRS
jgi:hypothetical protein